MAAWLCVHPLIVPRRVRKSDVLARTRLLLSLVFSPYIRQQIDKNRACISNPWGQINETTLRQKGCARENLRTNLYSGSKIIPSFAYVTMESYEKSRCVLRTFYDRIQLVDNVARLRRRDDPRALFFLRPLCAHLHLKHAKEKQRVFKSERRGDERWTHSYTGIATAAVTLPTKRPPRAI